MIMWYIPHIQYVGKYEYEYCYVRVGYTKYK